MEASELSPSLAITHYSGELLSPARNWTSLEESERRRQATVAARDYQVEELWSLTIAYLSLFGRAGAKVSPRTLRTYRQGMERFLTFAQLRAVSLLRPTRNSGALYIRNLEADGLQPSTVRVHLAAARSLFRALRWSGATESDPFSDVKPAADKTAPWDKRQPYRDDEIVRLLKYAQLRDQALILLCAYGGLRISEAVELTWQQVDLSAGQMTVKGKGGRVRRVRISKTLLAALHSLTPKHPELRVIGATQTAARQRLKRLSAQANVRYLGWHAMRHYAGTRLTRQTGNLEHAARHLGHSSIETTRVYAKWADSALDEALEGW